MGLKYGRRYATHHAWRHPSSAIYCQSCLLISTIKSPMITARIMLGHKVRHPRTNTQVLEARPGLLTCSNSVLVHGVTKVGCDLCCHQTKLYYETLAREGFSDTVVTERIPGRMEQGRSHRFKHGHKPQALASNQRTSLRQTVSRERQSIPRESPPTRRRQPKHTLQ